VRGVICINTKRQLWKDLLQCSVKLSKCQSLNVLKDKPVLLTLKSFRLCAGEPGFDSLQGQGFVHHHIQTGSLCGPSTLLSTGSCDTHSWGKAAGYAHASNVHVNNRQTFNLSSAIRLHSSVVRHRVDSTFTFLNPLKPDGNYMYQTL
jgi:hypothetical protein